MKWFPERELPRTATTVATATATTVATATATATATYMNRATKSSRILSPSNQN